MSGEEIYCDWIESHTIENERGFWIGHPDDPEDRWVGPFPSDTCQAFEDTAWDLAMGPGGAIDAMCP